MLATARRVPSGLRRSLAIAGVMLRLTTAGAGASPPSAGSMGGAPAGETIVRKRMGPSEGPASGASRPPSRGARVRAKTYALPVFAPRTTCASFASMHRKRTRGPATLARSGGSATARHATPDMTRQSRIITGRATCVGSPPPRS